MASLSIDSVQHIYYELLDGERDKPYLIFLHDALGCSAMWKDFPRLLCEKTGCPGLVYDRLGHGKSSPLSGSRTIHYLHQCALVELPAIITLLIPATRYFLVGHSDGGSIALIHASGKPVYLKGIITEAAHVFVEQETLAGIETATDAFYAGKLHRLSGHHGEKTADLFRAWSETWRNENFRSWNIEYLLPSIACPALILQGSEDRYGTIAQVESIASKALAAEKVMIAASGHVPHHEKTDLVLRLMSSFLRQRMGY
ncbi:MAG: alpha/beta hydrolase [Desulforhopalus sp.]|nr:alpha/beta hydrolase [Desulforhopalus sp.]